MPRSSRLLNLSAKSPLSTLWSRVHAELYRRTGGRFIPKWFGGPVMVIETVGRKSGERRTTMLTAAHEIDDSVVIIASYGGDDRHPAWYLNLAANPDVDVEMRGKKRAMHARVVKGAERDGLWSEITSKHANYAEYQRKTKREIPVVVLEPA